MIEKLAGSDMEGISLVSCAALLLDMDGVLVDSTPAVQRVWSNWAREHGLTRLT